MWSWFFKRRKGYKTLKFWEYLDYHSSLRRNWSWQEFPLGDLGSPVMTRGEIMQFATLGRMDHSAHLVRTLQDFSLGDFTFGF